MYPISIFFASMLDALNGFIFEFKFVIQNWYYLVEKSELNLTNISTIKCVRYRLTRNTNMSYNRKITMKSTCAYSQ